MKTIILKDLLYITDLYHDIDIAIYCEEYSIFNISGNHNDIIKSKNYHAIIENDYVYVDYLTSENDTTIIKAWINENDLLDFLNENKNNKKGLDLWKVKTL